MVDIYPIFNILIYCAMLSGFVFLLSASGDVIKLRISLCLYSQYDNKYPES